MRNSLRMGLVGAASSAALLIAGQASAAVIGGVTIDPEEFVLERAEVWESVVTQQGQELRGFGRVLSINNDANFCAGCELTFTFEDYVVSQITASEIAFTGGTVRFYVDESQNFNANPSHANAADGDLWLELAGMTFTDPDTGLTGTLVGVGVNFLSDQPTGFGDGRLQLVMNEDAIATEFFSEFAMPILFTSDFQNVGLGTGEFPLTGSATMTATREGAQIPEPATLGLLGAGLLGMGLLRRRKA